METHKFDILSFIFGVLFLAFTAGVLWEMNFNVGFDVGAWIIPVAILVIGIALLASAIRETVNKSES